MCPLTRTIRWHSFSHPLVWPMSLTVGLCINGVSQRQSPTSGRIWVVITDSTVVELPRRWAIHWRRRNRARCPWTISMPFLPWQAIVGPPTSCRLPMVFHTGQILIAYVFGVRWCGGKVMRWQVVVVAPHRSWVHGGFFILKMTHIHGDVVWGKPSGMLLLMMFPLALFKVKGHVFLGWWGHPMLLDSTTTPRMISNSAIQLLVVRICQDLGWCQLSCQ